jgi:hypothetical protein
MDKNFIFSPSAHTSNNSQSNKYFYCHANHAEFVDNEGNGRTHEENTKTLAKIIEKNNHMSYHIKVSNNNQLFNPLSKFDTEKSYSFLDNVVRPTDKFISVNSLVFSYYLKFLSTGNNAWLNRAERERL